MEKKVLKTYLLLITFTIGLVLVVIHFETILSGIGLFLRLLTPLFIGITIAFVLNRPYEWIRSCLERNMKLHTKTARIWAILAVYLIAYGVLALIISMVIPEVIQNVKTFALNADQYLLETQNTANRFTEALGLQPIDLSNLIKSVESYFSTLSSLIDEMIPQIIEVTTNVVSFIANAFISLALSVYIMSGKERLLMQVKRTVRVYLPKRSHRILSEMFRTVSQVFGDYVAGQCKEAIILGSLCFCGMMLLRLDYAGLISVIIAITALIPILGAYAGGAIGVILLLFVSPIKALIFLIFLVVLQQVEGNVIYPRVVGRKIGLPGMWVLVGISVGGGLFGIWGMLLAVPITTVLYQFLKKDVKRREKVTGINRPSH